ncbi:MAG: aldolase/citrate lyase family protein [Parcubacteria group bacterium]
MKNNKLKEKLKNGEKVFGTWSMLPAAGASNAIAQSGVDFVIIDMEHGPMSFETMEQMVKSIELENCQSIIRVSDKNEQTILRALEIGAQAVMVPHVSTVAEAEAVVKACKYKPDGERGLSPYTRVHDYCHENLAESMKFANENTLVGILVEGKEGIENIEKIAAVPGIDLIYLGIYDISQSVGLPGQLNHETVIEMQKKCAAVIRNAGKAAGSFARDLDYVEMLYKNGFQFIAYLVDCAILKTAYQRAGQFFRELSKDAI